MAGIYNVGQHVRDCAVCRRIDRRRMQVKKWVSFVYEVHLKKLKHSRAQFGALF